MLDRSRFITTYVAAAGLLIGIASSAHAAPCKFQVTGTITMVFITPGKTGMDPSVQTDAIGTASAPAGTDFWGSCSNTTMYMSVTGTQTMTGQGASIPYLLFLPSPVTNPPAMTGYSKFTLTGKVSWADLADKPAGPYSGTVTLNVTP